MEEIGQIIFSIISFVAMILVSIFKGGRRWVPKPYGNWL